MIETCSTADSAKQGQGTIQRKHVKCSVSVAKAPSSCMSPVPPTPCIILSHPCPGSETCSAMAQLSKETAQERTLTTQYSGRRRSKENPGV